ncbi:hypothetical protein KJ359_005447 [Pestalotiopsis sp. 9143b]|nr:hypothetical protein KJ359_005447 [Pestalotiopsis sp. 9143b]
MDGTKSSPQEATNNRANETTDFQFISIQNPTEAKDRGKRRLARSHAVRQALKNVRKSQEALPRADAVASSQTVSAWSVFVSPSVYGPFETLFGDSPRLRTLLSHSAARCAAEPVFSVAHPVLFQDFGSVFRTDIDDPALLNAVKLTFALAVTGGNMDNECIGYQNQTLAAVRRRMSSPDTALSLPTLGAILLLAGVEARLGMRWQVQLHMSAIRRLLDLGQSNPIYLTDGIKRAIFWQDLNASIMTGSDRVVDHTTFDELQWKRDPFAATFFVLAPGFQKRAQLFPEDFVEVLKDIHALQCVQDLPGYSCQNPIEMLRVDNHQASIGSRLVGLPKLSPVLEACHLAAYLSACMLCSKVWRHSAIPSYVSKHLLHSLQQSDEDLFWDHDPDLLTWMLHLGGSFSPKGTIRSGYKQLLQKNCKSQRFKRNFSSLTELIEVMRQFIWSEKAYRSQFEQFWKNMHTIGPDDW